MSRDVVFDLGGVVFRWEPLTLLQQLFPQRMPDEASARHWAGEIFQTFAPEADWALFDLGRIEPGPLAQRIAQRTGLSEAELQHLIASIPPHLTPLPGTVELIQALKAAGHRLYFLSNMPAPYARHLHSSHAFFDHFEEGIFSADVQQIKPLPDIFATAQARWPLREAPIFLDDVAHNIEAAQRHGWQGLLFKTPAQARAELVALNYLAD